MAHSLHIKGTEDKDNPQMVKLQLIFYKTGYNRVPKTISITGSIKEWDQESEIFIGKGSGQTTKNKRLLELKEKYYGVVDTWENEGRNWSAIQWAHCFDVVEKKKEEIKVRSILQMINYLEEIFKNKKRVKNDEVVTSAPNAKQYVYLRRSLEAFTQEVYQRALSSYYFNEINDKFLMDYNLWLKEKGIRNNNRGARVTRLRRFRAVCVHAVVQGDMNMKSFDCLGDDLKWDETESKAVSDVIIAKIENIDRTLFTKYEQFHLDIFLFSYYAAGMANVDVCYLTRKSIKEDTIVYERIKFPKTAKPILLKNAEAIIKKYEGTGYENYVFPIFTHKHTTTDKKMRRVRQFSEKVNKTLAKACKILHIKEHITWYSARGSFISKMVDAGTNPYIVAEMAGNSPMTIYKHYYKNTKKEELAKKMNEMF